MTFELLARLMDGPGDVVQLPGESILAALGSLCRARSGLIGKGLDGFGHLCGSGGHRPPFGVLTRHGRGMAVVYLGAHLSSSRVLLGSQGKKATGPTLFQHC